MFCACEIPSRDPCSGRSRVTWTSGLLQVPRRDSHPAVHVQLSSAAQLIKMCVAPPSLHPALCALEDHEGPCADTEVYLEF